ncbi:MAG TPA: M56 family metallopeptidase [Fimbriimonas sp.]|nr:M56 family metallopeptidase [Fimbriimonas sp.]
MTLDLLIEILIKSSILLAVGLGLRALIKKSNPALRHLVMVAAIVGSLAIPTAIPLVKYQTRIPVPQQFDLGNAPLKDGEVRFSQLIPSQKSTPAGVTVDTSWQTVVIDTWLAGCALIMLRYAAGLALLAFHRRSQSKPATSPFGEAAPRHELRVSTAPAPQTAMTWGIFRPTILLPMDSSNWTSHRMEMILLHELAHVRRKDFVSQLLTEIACAIYWFNPLVWQSARAMREDAELAADDAVIQAGVRPTDYATELLQLAANLSRGNLVLTRVGISTMTNSKIESRLKAILSSNSKARGITTVSILGAITLSGVAITTIASMKLHQEATPAQQKAESMSRLKQIAVATHIYSVDWDNRLPFATSTKAAEELVQPYIKNREAFKSPRLGAKFLYNLNLSGVEMKDIRWPAEAVSWYEVTPKGIDPNAVFVDGHAVTITSQNIKAFEKALKQKFPRGGGSPITPGIGG